MNGFFVLQSMLPKSMSSDLIRGWDHARMKSGCLLFGQQHAQLPGIDHVPASCSIQAKRIVI
jgi:hypothetical protein